MQHVARGRLGRRDTNLNQLIGGVSMALQVLEPLDKAHELLLVASSSLVRHLGDVIK